jgi:hypothetical protein
VIRGRATNAADTKDIVATDARSAVGTAIVSIIEAVGTLETK